jgi:hypothetical protein
MKTELERIGVRGVYGTISDANRGINASGLQYMAPENVYWEYSAGINIFKVFRIDFAWRGNYLNTPDTQRFSVKDLLDFIFRAISSCTLYLLPNLGIKGCRSIWAKKISA